MGNKFVSMYVCMAVWVYVCMFVCAAAQIFKHETFMGAQSFKHETLMAAQIFKHETFTAAQSFKHETFMGTQIFKHETFMCLQGGAVHHHFVMLYFSRVVCVCSNCFVFFYFFMLVWVCICQKFNFYRILKFQCVEVFVASRFRVLMLSFFPSLSVCSPRLCL